MPRKKKFDFKTMHLSDIPKMIVALFKGELNDDGEVLSEQTGKFEINLVPDIKLEMIKMQKIRNLIFFICIIISIASVSITLVLGSIKGAQDLAMSGQDSHMKNLSSKILGYDELAEFLTVQNQLRGIAQVENNQKVLSRAITLLKALMPSGVDTVEVSELAVDLKTSTLTFDGQANAGQMPDIDYRVLESFIKRTNMMTFDYGRYVDAEGNEIPSRCLSEYDDNGSMYQENGSIYAIWHRNQKGCDPGRNDHATNADGAVSVNKNNADLESTRMSEGRSELGNLTEEKKNEAGKKIIERVASEKIYRTPQFTKWHKGEEVSTTNDGIEDDIKVQPNDDGTMTNVTHYKYRPSMTTSGEISGIPHFSSRCITYSGEDDINVDGSVKKDTDGNSMIRWSAKNTCQLVPDGITVTDSSNGKNADDNLVLRFSATIKMNADVFAYRNKHMMAIGPNGQNVTDSYVQLEKIFAAPAVDCAPGDTSCGNKTNETGK